MCKALVATFVVVAVSFSCGGRTGEGAGGTGGGTSGEGGGTSGSGGGSAAAGGGSQSGQPDGGFCDVVATTAAYLKNALALCPGPNDSQLDGFDRANCDANAATACTADEQFTIADVSRCERTIPPCSDADGGAGIYAAVQRCASDGGVISSACSNAFTPP